MNEKGNSLIFSMLVLLLCSILGLNFIHTRLTNIGKQKRLQSLLICTKKLNGKSRVFIERMEKTNSILKTLTITKLASTTIPIYGAVAAKSIKVIKKIIKAAQRVILISFLNFVAYTALKNCSITPNIYKTPYKVTKSLDLTRDAYDQAILRGNTWFFTSKLGGNIIRNKFKIKPQLRVKTYFLKRERVL
jgi:hypothetical protein